MGELYQGQPDLNPKEEVAAGLAAHKEDDAQLTKKQVVDKEDIVKADQEKTTMIEEQDTAVIDEREYNKSIR